MKRPEDWSYAPGIPEEYQVDLRNHSYSSYNGGAGHAKGHQIPNADRNGNEEMQKQTFYVINSTPQIHSGLNETIWANLEDGIRNQIPEGDSLYVVTGPVFKTVGGSEPIDYTTASDDPDKPVAVPNYYFKVVMKVRRSGDNITDAETAGFWFEHKAYEKGTSYVDFIKSVDEIERLTGLDFFANLPNEIEATAETNTNWSGFCSF